MRKTPTGPAGYILSVEGQKGQAVRFVLSGRISLDNAYVLQKELRTRLGQMAPAKLEVDLSRIEYLDSSGALTLYALKKEAQKNNIPLAFLNTTPEAQRVMDLIDPEAIEIPPLRQEEELNSFE